MLLGRDRVSRSGLRASLDEASISSHGDASNGVGG
jgi:hypothetical protein